MQPQKHSATVGQHGRRKRTKLGFMNTALASAPIDKINQPEMGKYRHSLL